MIFENDDCIDIDHLDIEFMTEYRRKVAKLIALDTLDTVNKRDKKVVPKNTFYSKYGKRLLDIFLSGCALLVLSPVNLILAVCTFFDVGAPIIFRQVRIGKDEKKFEIIKFRNMTNETDSNGELLPASKRVTKFGRFVRKTSLDELLNFWSVFKGDMSIIGPRPLPEGYLERFSDRHRCRHMVRPGLECPVVIGNEYRPTWGVQFDNDIYYVENVSLLLDIKMCLVLFKMVFDRKSTSLRGNSNRGTFMGYNKDGSTINSHCVPKKYLPNE